MDTRTNSSSPPASFRRDRNGCILAMLLVGLCLAHLPASQAADNDSHPSDAKARHWSFQPIQNPPEPAVKNTPWPRTSIDPFILAQIEHHGLAPAQEADRRTLIRRATFDLIGLPPTPEEIDAFLADTSPDAFAKVVERLLDSPHYGERWGRHWLDVVRYADTAGETADYPVPLAWRYRNWVIDAFNDDRPYDEFLREQIAGDILARNGSRERYAERVTATGYLAISRRFGFDSENYHHLTIQDTIDTLGQNVLGLTLGCARCHDHKYDPVTMKEYYALYGIFDSTRYAFPGSEQKQKHRALVPLRPRDESIPEWCAFDTRVASLARQLEMQKQSGPTAVLRSLDDLDGDFEMQAVAAGGSKGVLVPPWLYEGGIAITTGAQSPFKNLHPLGKVGASVPAGTNAYRIAQALYPHRARGQENLLFVNLDFKVATTDPSAAGRHRFWIGAQNGSPAVEIFLSRETAALRAGDDWKTLHFYKPNEWQNLQLTIDLRAGTFSGRIGTPNGIISFANQPLASDWSGAIDFVAVDSQSPGNENHPLPALDLDNLGVQESPIAPVSTSLPALTANPEEPDPAKLTTELQTLAGIDGDFELQTDDTPPATPWGPGPNSVVRIAAGSQSPFRNHFGPGRLGVHMPNSGAYNGFGQTLTNRWQGGDRTAQLFASFDFRCASQDAGGDGSWRFYLGHGPGSSAAVELFFNGREFFRRSGDARDTVRSIRIGEWYQVQLILNLKERTYAGFIASATERTDFNGQVASGWDGSVDYTFIDSYGHLGGVKPALDADNFVIGETPLSPLDAAQPAFAGGADESRTTRARDLRRQLADLAGTAEKAKQELNEMLVNGPFELAYAVSEGTPHNVRLQQRGDPEMPGPEVPRGFIKVLGGGTLPPETSGSGRLELAEWLTSPDNPLTARVIVNRIWQYHFGRGLVTTPNDFGVRGQPPTHPALLDHLATRFMQSGWSIKAMHRLIMLSATYRQASASAQPGEHHTAHGEILGLAATSGTTRDSGSPEGGPPRGAPLDAARTAQRAVPTEANAPADTSHLLASFPRRRLSAEELRDAILFVSGELDPNPGQGHPFPAPTGWGYTQHGPFSAVYDHNQRSVYLMTQRLKRHPFLALFDGADPNASTPERRATTVPTQALFFLNDPFVHAKAEKFAQRLRQETADEAQQIVQAWRVTLGRSPTDDEHRDATSFLAAYRAELGGGENTETTALAAYLRALIGSNEFLHID